MILNFIAVGRACWPQIPEHTSKLFQYALCNFFPTLVYPVWPPEASGRPQRPKRAPNRVLGDVPKWYYRDLSPMGSLQRPQHPGRCSAHSGPSLTSQLFLGTDLRRKKPSRGPNEAQIVFLGTPLSDITGVYHSWAHYSAPTTPGQVFRSFWTKSELLTLPRD